MSSKARFEAYLTEYCKLNNISMSDPYIWSDLLFHCLFEDMPAEFVWENRLRPWNWTAIKHRYKIGAAMSVYRGKPWTWRRFIAYHST